MQRRNIPSGAPWESIVGYSRAVRVGPTIEISGTIALDETGKVFAPGDAYAQTRRALEIATLALERADASLTDVVRTRLFVTDISRWEEFGRAHGEFFAQIRPACTVVEVSRLVDPEALVEIEISARREP